MILLYIMKVFLLFLLLKDFLFPDDVEQIQIHLFLCFYTNHACLHALLVQHHFSQ